MFKVLFIVISFFYTAYAHTVDYPYKSLNDFKELSTFKNIDDFESSFSSYVNHCVDNTFYGTGGLRCYIQNDIWTRELDKYYDLLSNILKGAEKVNLENAHMSWVSYRDTTMSFYENLLVLSNKNNDGSLHTMLSKGNYNRELVLITKERALKLKSWFDSYHQIQNPLYHHHNHLNILLNKMVNGSDKEKERATYELVPTYTDNGSSGDVAFIDQNIDIFLHLLEESNPRVKNRITDLMINEYVTDLTSGRGFKYLINANADIKEKAVKVILANIKSQDNDVMRNSVYALLELTGCQYKNNIDEVTKKWEGAYLTDNVIEKVNKICPL